MVVASSDRKCSLHSLDDIQYVTSQKGRIQLLYRGFYYVKEKKIRNKVYWRCTQYTTSFRCHGRLHTEMGRIVHKSLHNHSSSPEGIRKSKPKKLFLLKDPKVTLSHARDIPLTMAGNQERSPVVRPSNAISEMRRFM